MAYKYDAYAWYMGEVEEGAPRSTEIEPSNLNTSLIPGQIRCNFTGYVWLETLFTLPAINVVPEAPAPRRITRLAFRNRFIQAEKVAIEIAQLDDSTAPALQRQQSAALRASLADTAAAAFIDLDRTDTRTGVQTLEALSLLAAGRALQILDTPIQADELPIMGQQ